MSRRAPATPPSGAPPSRRRRTAQGAVANDSQSDEVSDAEARSGAQQPSPPPIASSWATAAAADADEPHHLLRPSSSFTHTVSTSSSAPASGGAAPVAQPAQPQPAQTQPQTQPSRAAAATAADATADTGMFQFSSGAARSYQARAVSPPPSRQVSHPLPPPIDAEFVSLIDDNGLLLGEYVYEKLLGGGAYGTVCRAQHFSTLQVRAIKKVKRLFHDSSHKFIETKRIMREVHILREFEHE